MCNEEQTWILQTLSKASVVKCRHQRLAGAGRGNHEVPMTVMPITLRFRRCRISRWNGHGCRSIWKICDGSGTTVAHSAIKPSGVARRIVRLVVRIGPVALECGLELLDQIGRRYLRKTHSAKMSRSSSTVRNCRTARESVRTQGHRPRWGTTEFSAAQLTAC